VLHTLFPADVDDDCGNSAATTTTTVRVPNLWISIGPGVETFSDEMLRRPEADSLKLPDGYSRTRTFNVLRQRQNVRLRRQHATRLLS